MNFVKMICFFTFCIIILGSCNSNITNVEDMEYRTDEEVITSRFPDINDVVKCYWKAENIGKTDFGPSSYWMKGFIIVNDETAEKINRKYELHSTHIDFPDGIDPSVTGFSEFDWKKSKEFTKDIIRTAFVGEFYYDTLNGILYFDVESN